MATVASLVSCGLIAIGVAIVEVPWTEAHEGLWAVHSCEVVEDMHAVEDVGSF